MLLRFFGGCVSDRDQANEGKFEQDEQNASPSIESSSKNQNLGVPSALKRGSRVDQTVSSREIQPNRNMSGLQDRWGI